MGTPGWLERGKPGPVRGLMRSSWDADWIGSLSAECRRPGEASARIHAMATGTRHRMRRTTRGVAGREPDAHGGSEGLPGTGKGEVSMFEGAVGFETVEEG